MRRWWWLSLTGFFLIGAAWAVALPANGTYDEKDHIVRAYSVVTGHLTPRRTMVDRRGDVTPAFPAPASLLPSNASVDCAWSPRPAKTPACQKWTTDRSKIPTPSAAARYSPVYYLPVGVPLLLAPDLTGVVLARLVSALLTALLLAGAVGAAARLGSRLLAVGVVLAVTPLAVNLGGSINPNGLEIAAGVLVFCALLALVRAPRDRLDDRSTRRLLALACTGSVLLLTVREVGPALLALDVGACAALARPGRLADLYRHRAARWSLVGCWLAGAAFAVGWLRYSGFADIAPNTRDAEHLRLMPALHQIASLRIPFYLRQIVGQFGYGEVNLPSYVIIAWYLLAAALVVPCLIAAGWRLRIVLAALGVLSFGLLIALELYFLPRDGWFSQGRYAMPALVGLVLGAASAGGFERVLVGRGWLRGYAVGLVAAAGVLHLYALARVMTRFQVGIGAGLDPLGGTWRPLLGPLPALLAGLAGVGLLLALAVTVTRGDPARLPEPSMVTASPVRGA